MIFASLPSVSAADGAADADCVQLPDGRVLDADAFYAERDVRTTQDYAYRRDVFRVAVVLPAEEAVSMEGQTALLWACSMLRRMGRPFAATVIVAPEDAPAATYRAALHREQGIATLGEAVELELLGADPFAPLGWRRLGDVDALTDVEMALWIGKRPGAPPCAPEPPLGHVVVAASGWVGSVAVQPAGSSLEALPPRGSAAAAAVIAAAAFGVGAIYDAAQRDADARPRGAPAVWFSLESGQATTQPSVGAAWMARGAASEGAAPWVPPADAIGGAPEGAEGEHAAPTLDRLVLVSAGALGGNAGLIIAASYLVVHRADVVEFDRVALPNLNRQISVGVGQVGTPKGEPVGAALSAAGIATTLVAARYEAWAAAGEAGRLAVPGHAVLIGVDQVITRLHAQADWPALLVNGATAGTSWSVSVHPHPTVASDDAPDGCVGCFYATSRQPYAEIRRPRACAAGPLPAAARGAAGPANAGAPAGPLPMASYPFASVGAAAVMVATVIDHAWRSAKAHVPAPGARVVRANSVAPAFAMATPLARSPECRLLCGQPAVRAALLARSTATGSETQAVAAASADDVSPRAHTTGEEGCL